MKPKSSRSGGEAVSPVPGVDRDRRAGSQHHCGELAIHVDSLWLDDPLTQELCSASVAVGAEPSRSRRSGPILGGSSGC